MIQFFKKAILFLFILFILSLLIFFIILNVSYRNLKNGSLQRKLKKKYSNRKTQNSFDEPIDFVVTWVDGNDKNHISLKNKYKEQEIGFKPSSMSLNRFVHNNELRYVLRSVQMFVPWIRNIFIVKDGSQYPSFLNEDKTNDPNSKIKLIDHSEIFENLENLPTFNSHAIEANLHRIPGLSEYFIYANDDMFFGNFCDADFFIDTKTKKMKFYRHKNSYCDKKTGEHGAAWAQSEKLLNEIKIERRKYPLHQLQIMSKSLMFKTEEKFKEKWKETITKRFRSNEDIIPMGLSSYYGSYLGMVELSSTNDHLYCSYVEFALVKFICFGLVSLRHPILLCFNDNTSHTKDDNQLEEFLKLYFTEKCEWEKDE
jgi:hypothetical protein